MIHRSRRELLGIAGSAVAVSLGGCLDRITNVVDPASFSHPTGFDNDGIDGDVALGPDSSMASVSSVTLDTDWIIATPDFRIDGEMVGRFELAQERFVRTRRAFNSLSRELQITSNFFDSIELISRERLEPRSLGYRYSARSYSLDPINDLGLDDIRTTLEGVEARFDEARRFDGRIVGIYAAGTDDFGEGSIVRIWSESFGEPLSASLELGVTEDGHLTHAELRGGFETRDAEPIKLAAGWKFTDVDETTVADPEWLSEVPNLHRPAVQVEFEEVPGEVVLVRVLSMDHTEEVAVFIEGVGTFDSATGPGTIEVPADAFTTDDGRVRAIFIIADDRLRGPSEIDQYWPQPVRE